MIRKAQIPAMVIASVLLAASAVASGSTYLSPVDLAVADDGRTYVAARSGRSLLEIDPGGQVTRSLSLPEEPNSITLSPDGQTLYLGSEGPEGAVFLVDRARLALRATWTSGHTPMTPVPGPDNKLYVCDRFQDRVSVLAEGKVLKRIPVDREPVAAVLVSGGRRLWVANHLPDVPADGEIVSCTLSIIDTATDELSRSIVLPDGTTGIRDIALSADGRYVFVASLLARHRVPATQLERGWVNTDALIILDAEQETIFATVLLDSIDRAVANPWGIACGDDGMIYVSAAGVHKVVRVDGPRLFERLAAMTPDDRAACANDLSFLSDLKTELPLKGKGPRGIALRNGSLQVAQYFSDSLARIDLSSFKQEQELLLAGMEQAMDPVRRGEFLFNDATICFQNWMSCASCHPDTRTDAINWDLLNDGIGNPKNAKSMLFAHSTPPTTYTGCRPNAFVSVRAGIRFLMSTLPEEDAEAIDAFIMAMTPVPSPYLVDGGLSPAAERGKELFEGKAGCIHCHSGELHTGLQSYDLGLGVGMERGQKFDTPTLREVWRTRPYLHDGRAVDLYALLVEHNPLNRHGQTSDLSEDELNDLIEYVNSL